MKIALACALALVPSVATADKTYTGGKGTSWDCSKDPVVFINHGLGTYAFTGACKQITINGGMNKLKVEKVDTLAIEGGMNTVTLDNVDVIKVNGSTNTITWKKSSGDKPKIDVIGTNNKVEQGK